MKMRDGGANLMDQTCIDSDDDDLEFDDARKEENEDVLLHDISAFMVSKGNISRYQEQTLMRSQMPKDTENDDEEAKKPKTGNILPDNFLDTEPKQEKKNSKVKPPPAPVYPDEDEEEAEEEINQHNYTQNSAVNLSPPRSLSNDEEAPKVNLKK